MDHRIEEILIPKRKIKSGIKKAAKWIDNNYSNTGRDLVLIGLLKGCIPFYGQLISYVKTDLIMDFMVVSSFKGAEKATGLPEIVTDIYTDIEGKDVLLLEDIVDSGYTIKYVREYLVKRKPNSIKVLSLLDKKAGRKVDFQPDYYCFDIEDKFLVGFGLDYQEKLRNLPYIGVFKKVKK
ncbi:hypoxanthine phosphoribosyltransferase [Malacoplasma muris]|uniref:hypoxanthine phosphoribosyltransferase n=1 Tax=Malacoplasma muris TaxID=2119 RepID=UPI00398F5FCA